MTTFKFKTDSDKWLVINALISAATDFEGYSNDEGHPESVRREFADQAAAAGRIAQEIEDA